MVWSTLACLLAQRPPSPTQSQSHSISCKGSTVAERHEYYFASRYNIDVGYLFTELYRYSTSISCCKLHINIIIAIANTITSLWYSISST